MELTEGDKKDLLNEFNRRGYILEDKMAKILSDHISGQAIWKNPICVEYGRRNNGERVEVDVILKLGDKLFVADAKRTDYDWIFSPALDRPKNVVNVIYLHSQQGHIVKPMVLGESPNPKMAVNHDFAIKINDDGTLGRTRGDKLSLPDRNRPIHDAVRQVLKESKAVLLEGSKYISTGMFLIPIIVTNAKLLYLDYKNENINEAGDLANWDSLEEVKAVGFNFHEYFGFNTEQGFRTSEQENVVKTVFIINIKYVKEIVEYLSGLHL